VPRPALPSRIHRARAVLQHIFFSGWQPVLRTAISTASAFVVLIIMMRLAGPRVLAKWYAFDLVITVALGSSFATFLLSPNASVAQIAAGFLVLILFQIAISWVLLHWSATRTVVNPCPSLMLLNGKFQNEAMRKSRVSEADIRAAVRHHGLSTLDDVGAVVLEADGSFSVMHRLSGPCSALADIPELGGSDEANKTK
jgi:uncharacterized membrane protein YcaP (DUF421 family)